MTAETMTSHFIVWREPFNAALIGDCRNARGTRASKEPNMLLQRIILVFAVSAGSLVANGAAVAQDNRGTMEQQMACTPDVFRLCGAQIPDADRIVACLRYNTAQLSEPCRAVFTSNENAQQPAQPVRRGDRTARVAH
jgi:hypothetical protein